MSLGIITVHEVSQKAKDIYYDITYRRYNTNVITNEWFKSNEWRAVGRVSRHTEDAGAPRAQQGWALPLPSPPKVKGVEMAQQDPSKGDGHGDGCLQGRGITQGYSRWQRKAAQSRAGVAKIYPRPSLCSNCQLLLPKRQSQWEASGQGRQTVQTRGASFLVTEQRRL